MTITKEFASKLAVAFVAVAMVFSAFATSAKAQTTEDLQALINDLLAQVAALQSQIGQGDSMTSSVCPYTWTRDLNTGATGADVMKLQMFLNSDADTRVAATGAGSVGAETEYYGPATAAAVSKFQVKYRSDILSPANLVNPTGYFGPSSRAKANGLCVAAPVVEDDTTVDDTTSDDTTMDDSSSDDSTVVTLSGEADLDTFEISDADDSTIDEGSDDAAIGEITVNFSDGDAEISRIDLAFDSSDVNADPWNAFDSISFWVDGDKVAEEDASSRNDYVGNENNGIIRLSGLDIVGMEDEDVVITVAANIQNGLDTEELSTWTMTGDSMRYFDADGVASTESGTIVSSESSSFDIQEAGTDDEIQVKSNSNDPDGTTFQVEDNAKSDWYTVFVFDLDTKDSVNDITLNTIDVSVATTVASYSTLVDDAEIIIDGQTISSNSGDVDATGDAAVITFDVDRDVTIDAGDRVEAEVRLKFKSMSATTSEGATVQLSVDGDNIDAEGSDDLTTTQLSGVQTSEEHTLRTKGIEVDLSDTSAAVTTGDSALDDYATFTIEVDVTAFEQDVYISTTEGTSLDWDIVDAAGAVLTGGNASTTVVLSSTANDDDSAGYYLVSDGETETFTIQGTFDPDIANVAARLQLNDIFFDEDASSVDQTWMASPVSTYRTDVVTVVN